MEVDGMKKKGNYEDALGEAELFKRTAKASFEKWYVSQG